MFIPFLEVGKRFEFISLEILSLLSKVSLDEENHLYQWENLNSKAIVKLVVLLPSILQPQDSIYLLNQEWEVGTDSW